MKYEARIEALVATYLEGPPTLSPTVFFTTLGCRVLATDGSWTRIIEPSRQPHPAYEPLVATTLLKAMRWSREWEPSDNQFAGALLDGLAKNERWRLCIETSDDAYFLAGLLIRLSHLDGPPDVADDDHSKMQKTYFAPAIEVISSGWLGESYSGDLTIDALTRGFFGDAWSALVLHDRPMHYAMVSRILSTYRPPFLPGLCPGQVEINAEQLPEIECRV